MSVTPDERTDRNLGQPMAGKTLPTGTVTFLFTDIEGSTVRWDRSPGAMKDAVRLHDTIMRAAIDDGNGVVFKTIGDAFCAAFWCVEDGIRAALQAQRALAAENFESVDGLRVRMALHVGESDERDSDYFGPTLNRVARLLSIGHGAQVLISGGAADAARPSLPPDVTLKDEGEHRLKDLTSPEHVFQLVAHGLPSEFPKLRSLSVLDNNLPQFVTSFVGRENDVAEIITSLRANRLITLLGTGGLGKTRCAIQVGAELLDQFPDGVWFVELAPLSDASLLVNEIGLTFGVQETPKRPLIETIVDSIRKKRLLLIVDNCEHLVAEAASAIGALLKSCPDITILATSREALGVRGEIVYRMPTLAVPTARTQLTAATAASFGAIALFEARARAVNSRFTLDDDNAHVVAEICRRLDGIPLAIELAAARIKALSVRDLAKRLDERFRLLTGGDRTALPRQQTLRALIDWSYDSLAPAEQDVFRALSVFAGGFDLDAVTAVCESETYDSFEILDHVASLVDKSLVLVETARDESRYRLLESMRAYGREKLAEAGDDRRVASRHAAAFVDRAELLQRDYETAPYAPWSERVEFDLENVRAALTFAFDGGDVMIGQRLAATLGRVLLTSSSSEARRWVRTALAAVDDATPSPIVARLQLADASLASVLNQFKPALDAASEALSRFTQLNDVTNIAHAQRFAGRSMIRMNRVPEGETLLNAALETYRELGFRRTGGPLRDLAVARGVEGDLEGARVLFGRALTVFRANGDDENVAITAAALAEAEFACGDAAAAVPLAEEALAGIRTFGRDRLVATILGNIAAYSIALGDFDAAAAHARESLELAREVDAEVSIVFALQHLCAVDVLRTCDGNDEEARIHAARLLGFVDQRIASLEIVRETTERQEYERVMRALFASLSPDSLMSLMNDGRGWSIDEAVSTALAPR